LLPTFLLPLFYYLLYYHSLHSSFPPHTHTHHSIENGVLRGNLPPPTINPFPKAPFSPDDPRLPLACTQPDARIHFALNCAARGYRIVVNYYFTPG